MNTQVDPKDFTAGEEPSSLSLMGGVANPEGLPEAADLDMDALHVSRRTVSQGTMLILLVVLIAAGSLYAMRLGQGDLASGGVPAEVMTKIEAALARSDSANAGSAVSAGLPTRSAFQDTDTIVQRFSSDVTKRQIPLDYVQKNPFLIPVPDKTEVVSDNKPASQARQLELERKLKGEFSRLNLQSVMANARIPVVVINGQLFKAGQTLGSFTITGIADRGVDLEASGMKFTLTMQDQSNHATGR